MTPDDLNDIILQINEKSLFYCSSHMIYRIDCKVLKVAIESAKSNNEKQHGHHYIDLSKSITLYNTSDAAFTCFLQLIHSKSIVLSI